MKTRITSDFTVTFQMTAEYDMPPDLVEEALSALLHSELKAGFERLKAFFNGKLYKVVLVSVDGVEVKLAAPASFLR